MKRFAMFSLITALLLLIGSHAYAAAAGGSNLIGAGELQSVTAGLCNNCDSTPDNPSEPSVRYSHSVWEVISSRHNPPTELRHELARDYVNSGYSTQTHSFTYDDQCSRVLVSGGVGVSKGLSLNVGTVYTCAMRDTYQVVVPARTRAKVYRAFMRQLSSYVVEKFDVYTDGSMLATGARDSGVVESRYLRYNTIFSPY